RLGRFDAVAVLGENVERRQVAHAGLRMAASDDAAAGVASDGDDRLADADAAADPLVLLVRSDPVDPEQHPEAARVDRLGDPGRLAHRLERAPGEDRNPRAPAAVDARPG